MVVFLQFQAFYATDIQNCLIRGHDNLRLNSHTRQKINSRRNELSVMKHVLASLSGEGPDEKVEEEKSLVLVLNGFIWMLTALMDSTRECI